MKCDTNSLIVSNEIKEQTEDNKNTKLKKTANKKEFIVKGIFVGNKELKDIIWKVAESKAIRDMGLSV